MRLYRSYSKECELALVKMNMLKRKREGSMAHFAIIASLRLVIKMKTPWLYNKWRFN